MRKDAFTKIFILFISFIVYLLNFAYSENIKERFSGQDSLSYEVFFNGIPSGSIEWHYLGKKDIDGRQVQILSLISDTKILKLLNLESEEKVFLDSGSLLPVKVERDVVFFGKKELIEEIYNQDEGLVTITKNNSSDEETVLHQEKPIHNILSLLYFFPKDIHLVKGKELDFNLPTQKIVIKMLRENKIKVGKVEKEVYFLSGNGGRKFNLWLDKKERIPIKMEFIVPLGKVTILRKI